MMEYPRSQHGTRIVITALNKQN